MMDSRARTFVIVGNGIAGVTAAEIVRAEDAAAQIFIVADDPYPVYYRPALKDFLAGRVRENVLRARPGDFYAEQRITCVLDRVTGIAVEQQYVQLQSGRQLGYDRLLLANGARPNTLACPGSNIAGVTTLRSVADYKTVLSRLGTAHHIVVVGSGTLALESVESLRQRGYAVSHLLRHNTLWSEVLDATASDLVLQQEMRDGADVLLEEEVVEITGEQGQVSGVVTTKGRRIPCDMVIIAIGIAPNIDCIQRSGIGCGRGVRVDAMMRTNAPAVYAAGDIVETSDGMTGRTRVIGQWYPAIQQARAAAYSMLEVLDTSQPFQTSTFYNATFLYGLDFASVGITNSPPDYSDMNIMDSRVQTLVADPQPRTYRKVTLANGVPVGMLSLGDRTETLAFKRAIDYRVNLAPVASNLFADHFNLSDWLDSQGVPPPILGVKRVGEYAESVL
ncbi:MAG: NAD(P)/FAD-dependent oxidoreductase [Ktedonobacteraceae bacterium]